MEAPLWSEDREQVQSEKMLKKKISLGRSYSHTLLAQLFTGKCQFCIKKLDFVWEPPECVKISVRSRGEKCWKTRIRLG